jgi:hypothetical protein
VQVELVALEAEYLKSEAGFRYTNAVRYILSDTACARMTYLTGFGGVQGNPWLSQRGGGGGGVRRE